MATIIRRELSLGFSINLYVDIYQWNWKAGIYSKLLENIFFNMNISSKTLIIRKSGVRNSHKFLKVYELI